MSRCNINNKTKKGRKQSPAPSLNCIIKEFQAIEDYEPYVTFCKKPEQLKKNMPRNIYRIYLTCQIYQTQNPLSKTELISDLPKKLNNRSLLPPVRNYFNPKRNSYGLFVQSENVFNNSYHVGDDLGFRREGLSVISTANGIVKVIGYSSSCGYYIITEHRYKNKIYCTVNMHLSPFIYVKTGDIIRKGEKLGSIGRRYTMDNGGYQSHLHFSIHKGPFGTGKWFTGYLGKLQFKSKKHGWLNPQKFLKKYTKKASRFIDKRKSAAPKLQVVEIPSSSPRSPKSRKRNNGLSVGTTRYYPSGWTKPKVIRKGNKTTIKTSRPIFRKQTTTGITIN